MVGMDALKQVGNSEGEYPDEPGPATNENGEPIMYFRWVIQWVKPKANLFEAESARLADATEPEAEAVPDAESLPDVDPNAPLN
jgi:hypothetical protein